MLFGKFREHGLTVLSTLILHSSRGGTLNCGFCFAGDTGKSIVHAECLTPEAPKASAECIKECTMKELVVAR